MKLVFIDNIKKGMVVGQDIFLPGASANPLVRKNARLTSVMIESLIRMGISFAYIDDSAPSQKSSILNTTQNSRNNKIYIPKQPPIISKNLSANAVTSLENVFDIFSFGKDDVHSSAQVISQIDNVVDQLVLSLQKEQSALVNINDLKSYDEYTFHHSLSVAVISIAIAQYMGFGDVDLKQIGFCAIMHDIGKTAIPIELIHKSSKLSADEFEMMKMHSPAGFDYLNKTKLKDDVILQGVLSHHEKYDGTGYPNGLKGDEIPLWSRIIAVADVYDALTSNRPYREPMQPAAAMEYIMGSVGTAFDYDTVFAFYRKIQLYPIGSFVELSNGVVAVVLNNEHQLRPVIKRIDNGDVLDLYGDRQYLNIVINRILPEEILLKTPT